MRSIFEADTELIHQCDIVIANMNEFRGKEPDSGTVWECGYAHALGKEIYLYVDSDYCFHKKFETDKLHYDNDLKAHIDDAGMIVADCFKVMPVNLMLGCANDGIIHGSFEDCLKVASKSSTKQKVETTEYSYDGEWRVGPEPRHGKGHCVWKDGQTYEGQWKNDQPEGEGRMIYADGSHYTGNWKKGNKQGQGVHVWADGASYSGTWSKDIKDGPGQFAFPDGVEYVGECIPGKKHGLTTFTLKNSDGDDSTEMESPLKLN